MKTTFFDLSGDGRAEIINKAAEVIRAGGLVAFPTETVYGLGANGFDEKAVLSIFEAKGRPHDNPLIMHVADLDTAAQLGYLGEAFYKLAAAYWPGPLTIIVKKRPAVNDIVTCGLDSVAIRMPSNEYARELIAAAGVPIAAPSANRSGKPSPVTARHVLEDMDGRIDMILDGGACEVGVESTVVTVCGETPTVLRPGGITPEQIKEALGSVALDKAVTQMLPEGEKPLAPGMKYKHYSPDCRVVIVEGGGAVGYIKERLAEDERACALCFNGAETLFARAIPYGDEGDSLSLAHGVFNAMREADGAGISTLFVRRPPMDGVGIAVYNRLFRAAAGNVVKVDR